MRLPLPVACILAITLIATGTAWADEGASTTASLDVNGSTDLDASLTTTKQTEGTTFTVTLQNRGNTWITTRTTIDIFSKNTTIDQLDLGDVTLSNGENATLTRTWYPDTSGTFNATMTVTYGGNSLKRNISFEANRRTTEDVQRRGNPFLPESSPNELSFTRRPALIEAHPGEPANAYLSIHNPTPHSINNVRVIANVTGDLEGLVGGERRITIQPGEHANVSIPVTIPTDTEPGTYPVNVTLQKRDNLRLITESDHASTIYAIRVKQKQVETPTVLRTVEIDNNNLKITLNLQNGLNTINRTDVIENVPKTIAPTSDHLTFHTPTPTILERDPVLKWSLTDLDPLETRTLTYDVQDPKNTDGDFETTLNWNDPQLTTFPSPRGTPLELEVQTTNFRFHGWEAAERFTGLSVSEQEGTVTMTVTNLANTEIDAVAILQLPDGLGDDERIDITLPAGSVTTINRTINLPPGTPPGSYEGHATVTYSGGEEKTTYTMRVRDDSATLNLLVAIIVIITGVLALSITRYVKK